MNNLLSRKTNTIKFSTQLFCLLIVTLPVRVMAQNEIINLANDFRTIIDTLIPAMAGLAIVAFFYGLAMYIFKAGDEEAQTDAKSIMIGGVIAMFIIFALPGIIDWIGNILGINTTNPGTIEPPEIELNSS